MNKLFGVIAVIVLTIGLIGFVFNLSGEYDFMAQVAIVSKLPFSDPISDLKEIILEMQNLIAFEGAELAWYEYFVRFFEYVGYILYLPIVLFKDVAQNLYFGLYSVLIILGFTY